MSALERFDGLAVESPDAEQSPYQLVTQGALSYIANREGTVLSDGFHEFETYVAEDEEHGTRVAALLGKLGAGKQFLRIPTEEGKRFDTLGEPQHELVYRFDLDSFTGTSGALTYLLDPATGQPRSKGYHAISQGSEGPVGSLGAITEAVKDAQDSDERDSLDPTDHLLEVEAENRRQAQLETSAPARPGLKDRIKSLLSRQ